VCSEGKCVGVKLELQGHSFQVDLRVIDLGTYDVVLGMDWMRTISPFYWDNKSLTLSLKRGPDQLILKVSCGLNIWKRDAICVDRREENVTLLTKALQQLCGYKGTHKLSHLCV